MFKEVVIDQADTINVSQLTDEHIIVAKRSKSDGGLIMKEKAGYILRSKNGDGSSGHHETIQDCIKSDAGFGYKFYIL